jgi:hypothetical protein
MDAKRYQTFRETTQGPPIVRWNQTTPTERWRDPAPMTEPRVDRIPVGDLWLDPDVQTPERFSLRAAKLLLAKWDDNACKPLGVIRYPDLRLSIWDGGHRRWCVLQRYDATHPVLVHWVDGTQADAARLFAHQHDNERRVGAGTRFGRELLAGEPMALAIRDALNDYDWGIVEHGSAKRHGIACVRALEMAYQRLGDSDFRRMLQLIHLAWEHDPDSVTDDMMHGLSRFLYLYGDRVDDAVLLAKLRDMRPHDLVGKVALAAAADAGRPGQKGANAVAEALRRAYSAKRRSGRLDARPDAWSSPGQFKSTAKP